MAKTHDLPFALWKANLDLQARIARVLQDSGQAWTELGTRAAGEGAAEFDAQLRRLAQGDWQAFATLPVEAFWRQFEQRVGDGQAVNQAALKAQEDFVQGLLAALQDWQRQLAQAWPQGADTFGPGVAEAWRSLAAQWDAGAAAASPPPGRGTPKAEPRPGAKRAPGKPRR